MKDKIIEIAKNNWVDEIKFQSINAFPKNSKIFEIMPETKAVICLCYGLLRGMFRGIEEGTTYYQYTTMAVENMEETIMPMAQLLISNYIESKGYIALPERRHQTIMNSLDDTNFEVAYDSIYRGVKEPQLNFEETAVICGIGEKGLINNVINKEFGPLIRYCFILTDAEIEPDIIENHNLCDNCKKCVKACPGKAINDDGTKNNWQCAVYYNGANGIKNPFMPPDAFKDFDNRLDIISGNVKVDKDSAKKILDNIYFYPPAQHSYQCSICGKACDIACYSHLEEKGVLSRKYKDKYKKRQEWSFSIKDYE